MRRGRNSVERKIEHSKASTSIMFCGSASGKMLPPMVVYKSKFLYDAWINGGPVNSVYDSTKSGWFDGRTFKKWFFNIFVKNLEGEGPFALIGDNLGSHFSEEVIKVCVEMNIRFITLVPNSTHLCQPLDLAVFGPLKRCWRALLNEWRRESRKKGTLPKQHFPLLLNRLFNKIKEENLFSGFRGSGICPLNEEEVLRRMNTLDDSITESAERFLGGSVVKVLQENLGVGNDQQKKASKKRGRKINPGEMVVTLEENKENENVPDPSGLQRSKIVIRERGGEDSEEEVEVSIRRKPTARKNKERADGKEFRKNMRKKALDIWKCEDCEEEYNDNDPCVWIECDVCSNKFHLECSGYQYKTKDY